jgi:sulfite reductase beta subunit-like hemoprotein
MPYTIDDECCDNIDQYISDQQGVVAKLAKLYAEYDAEGDNRDFIEILKDNGLGVAAVAGGGMSEDAKKKARCFQEIIEEIESSHAVNVTQAIQLGMIGGVGYWNPFSSYFWDGDAARTQWMLARFAIELFRAKWLLSKLIAVRELCKARKKRKK